MNTTRHVMTLAMIARCAVALTCAAPAAGWAQRIVDLGPTTSTSWSSLNDAGQVAGFDVQTGSVLLYSSGSVSVLWAGANNVGGLNNAGMVAGAVQVGGSNHAAVFSAGGMQDLGTPGGTVAHAYGVDINDAGQVVGGYTQLGSPIVPRAFLSTEGSMTDIGTLGGVATFAHAVNATGQVTGYSFGADNSTPFAYLYSNGTMTNLGVLGDGYSIGRALNDRAQVVGVSFFADSTGGVAFLYDGGTMSSLGTLGGTYSSALGINEAGVVVGTSSVAVGGANHAFIYESGVMSDLNQYATAGWVFDTATDINENGDILGWGTIDGERHAFLLSLGQTPVPGIPEPSTYVLLGAGLFAVAAAGRRRRDARLVSALTVDGATGTAARKAATSVR